MAGQNVEQRSLWYKIKQFVHLRRFAFTVFLPLMGAATAAGQVTSAHIFTILVMAFSFHVFTYVLNDVIDLSVDRLMPKRAGHPLVRGEIAPKTALGIALLQIPLLLLTAWLTGISTLAIVALVVAILCMAIYDLWGKRNTFPPITDLIQALSWGSLTLYGAWVVGSQTFLTCILASIFVVFILLMNGVFEGVIDIEEDSAAQLKTTAMVFGVKPRGAAEMPSIPISLLLYCIVLELILSALNLIPLLRNDFGYSMNMRIWILFVVLFLNAVIVWLSIRLISPSTRFRKRIRDGHIDLMSAFSILILLIAYTPYLGVALVTIVLLSTILPLIL
jgi:4-hydroxybenzoate polyprenyltransferase